MDDYKLITVTSENIEEMRLLVDHPLRIGDTIGQRVPWTIEYYFSPEGQARSWARALEVAFGG